MALDGELLLFIFIYSDIGSTPVLRLGYHKRSYGIYYCCQLPDPLVFHPYLRDAKSVVSDNTRLVHSFAPSLEALSFAISHIACISS